MSALKLSSDTAHSTGASPRSEGPSTPTRDQAQQKIRASSRAVSRIVEGQALILDVNRDEIRQLNEVGSLIWSMILKSETSRDELLKRVMGEFEVEREQALLDLDEFLEALESLGLIEQPEDA